MNGYRNRSLYVEAEGPTVSGGMDAGSLLTQTVGAKVSGSVQVTGLMMLAVIATLVILTKGLAGAIG